MEEGRVDLVFVRDVVIVSWGILWAYMLYFLFKDRGFIFFISVNGIFINFDFM